MLQLPALGERQTAQFDRPPRGAWQHIVAAERDAAALAGDETRPCWSCAAPPPTSMRLPRCKIQRADGGERHRAAVDGQRPLAEDVEAARARRASLTQRPLGVRARRRACSVRRSGVVAGADGRKTLMAMRPSAAAACRRCRWSTTRADGDFAVGAEFERGIAPAPVTRPLAKMPTRAKPPRSNKCGDTVSSAPSALAIVLAPASAARASRRTSSSR